jgi:hypothetical protein
MACDKRGCDNPTLPIATADLPKTGLRAGTIFSAAKHNRAQIAMNKGAV